MDPDVDYLQPDFDPKSVTMPRLRSILVMHNINYPATAKKPQLVEIFNEHIAPQARKILQQRAINKRTSMGIVNANETPPYRQRESLDAPPSTLRADSHSRSPTKQARTPKPRSSVKRESMEPDIPPPMTAPRLHQSRSTSRQPSTDFDPTAQSSPIKRVSRRTLTPHSPSPPQLAPPQLAPQSHRPVQTPLGPSHANQHYIADSDEEDNSESEEEQSELDENRQPTPPRPSSSHSTQSHYADYQRSPNLPTPRPYQYQQDNTSQFLQPTPTPATREEAPSKKRESFFSDDNPFQSGSSPVTATARKPTSARRRTVEPSTSNFFQGSNAIRTQSKPRISADAALLSPPSHPSFRPITPPHSFGQRPFLSSHDSGSSHASVYDTVDAGEDFTPEAQLELEQELALRHNNPEDQPSPFAQPQRKEKQQQQQQQQQQIQVQPLPSMQVRHTPRRSLNLTTPLWVLFLTLLGAYAAWYRQEKIAVGYCGLGRPATQVLPQDIQWPDWLQTLAEPACEPCPRHAYCYRDFVVRCEQDFVLKPHPLSLYGLVPIPPTCEPDGEKARRVKAVADKALEELRGRRARYECGGSGGGGSSHSGGDAAASTHAGPTIQQDELKALVGRQRSKKLSAKEFDDLWEAALHDILGREEVKAEIPLSANDTEPLLTSVSLARISLSCAIRRAILESLARHRVAIGSVISLVALALYARIRYQSHVALSAQIPALVDTVLDRLTHQKLLSVARDIDDDPWLFLPNLRDDVLRHVHSLADRERVWKRVRAVVEQNSNVRTGQRESRSSGEVGRAWEWIGPLGPSSSLGGSGSGAEDSPYSTASLHKSRRRSSYRPSWIGPDDSPDASDPETKTKGPSKEAQRPLY